VVFFFFLVKVSMAIYLQLCYSGLFHQVSIQIGGMVIFFFGYLHITKYCFFSFGAGAYCVLGLEKRL
jgi:hypothetical protein